MAGIQPLTLEPPPHIDHRAVPDAVQAEGITPDDMRIWIQQNRQSLEARLTQSGAILFRGFPLTTTDDFDEFIRLFDYPNFRYEESLSNAVRIVRTDRVFSANEAPSDVRIFLHHEMAQTPVYPGKLFFFCEIAAEHGGATPLCRSDLLFEKLEQDVPEFASDCASKGLKYTNVMPGNDDASSGMGRSWRSTWRADDRTEAEQRMAELGYTWTWLDDDCLQATTPVLPAVMEFAPGRRSFFNQLIAASRGWKDSRNDPSKAISYGDGTPFDFATAERVADLAEEFTYDLQWQPGDVALVDNVITMHARKPFKGQRKVWASLVAAN